MSKNCIHINNWIRLNRRKEIAQETMREATARGHQTGLRQSQINANEISPTLNEQERKEKFTLNVSYNHDFLSSFIKTTGINVRKNFSSCCVCSEREVAER